MTDRVPTTGPDAPAPRRRWLAAGILVLGAAYAVLLVPYVRALWWLHCCPAAPPSLVLPVQGVAASALDPSFGAARWFGPHEGIDIVARGGTPVLAAADGIVIGNRTTAIGGTVLWVLGTGRRLYYYAHLRERAPGTHLGRSVAAGEPIGTVGNTGDAANAPPHLHFAIYAVESDFYPLRYTAIDPYPVLTGGTSGSPADGAAGAP